MLKDIPSLKVQDLGVAIVPREAQEADNEIGEVELWDAFLINLKKDTIFNVIVSMKGYGEKNNERIETSNFRVFIEKLEPNNYVVIEPIASNIFHLTNQYWVSYTQNNIMFDKKYVFVKGSIQPMNFTTVPLVDKKGVLIK